MVRPGVLPLVLYAFWVPLPTRYREWVLHDTTCSTWILRHVLRTLAAVAVPVAAIALWLPAGGAIRALTAFVTGACAVLGVTLYINESTDLRLAQAGYPWGTGERMRAERSVEAQRRASERRWERVEARRLRRLR